MCAAARAREGQGVRNGLCTGGALRINSLSGAVCTGRVRNGVCARSTACAQRRVCKRGGGPAWQVACAQGLVRGGGRAQRVVRGGKDKMSSAGVSLLLLSHVRLKSRHAKKSHVSSSFRSPRPPQVRRWS